MDPNRIIDCPDCFDKHPWNYQCIERFCPACGENTFTLPEPENAIEHEKNCPLMNVHNTKRLSDG